MPALVNSLAAGRVGASDATTDESGERSRSSFVGNRLSELLQRLAQTEDDVEAGELDDVYADWQREPLLTSQFASA